MTRAPIALPISTAVEFVGELTLDAVRKIRTPILLVYGEKSHFLGSYRFLSEALPNCKPVLLPGGEHFGPLEQPELLVEHIQSFLGLQTPVNKIAPGANAAMEALNGD